MPLAVTGLETGYAGKRVVLGASLRVGEREIVTVIGANGAGKTTLLKGLFGILKVSAGRVEWDGKDSTNRTPSENVRAGISYSPQGAPVYRSLTVADNLALAGFAVRDQGQVRRNRQRVLDLFPILARRRGQRAGFLSGGERQMLSLGCALVSSPRLIILDEPSGGLAPIVVENVFSTIQNIVAEFGAAVLMVEQNLQQAFAIAHRVYVMAGGRITGTGTPEEMEKDAALQEQYFGDAGSNAAETANPKPTLEPAR